MIRAVICDDEAASLVIIRYLIESESLPVEIVGTASNGQEALDLIRKEDIAKGVFVPVSLLPSVEPKKGVLDA